MILLLAYCLYECAVRFIIYDAVNRLLCGNMNSPLYDAANRVLTV